MIVSYWYTYSHICLSHLCSDPIVPQISTSKDPPTSSSSTDNVGMRSPGARTKFKTRSEGLRLPSDSALPRQIQVHVHVNVHNMYIICVYMYMCIYLNSNTCTCTYSSAMYMYFYNVVHVHVHTCRCMYIYMYMQDRGIYAVHIHCV